jgi:hypothetical protein
MNRRQHLDSRIQQLQDELCELINEAKNLPKIDLDILSWKDILNTYSKFAIFRNMEDAARAAESLGYPFYSWNDRIYETDGNFVVAIYDREIDSFKAA